MATRQQTLDIDSLESLVISIKEIADLTDCYARLAGNKKPSPTIKLDWVNKQFS